MGRFGGHADFFDECFSAVMRALDRRFEEVGGDYMGFASVRDAVFADVRDALDRGGPASEVGAGPPSTVERCVNQPVTGLRSRAGRLGRDEARFRGLF